MSYPPLLPSLQLSLLPLHPTLKFISSIIIIVIVIIYIKSIQSNWYFLFEHRFGDSHLDINNLSGGSSLKKTDFLLPLPLTSC